MLLKHSIQSVWHPEFLGMGDVLTLIEKAQANVDEEKAKELEAKDAHAVIYI